MKNKKDRETITDYHAEFASQLAGKSPEQLTIIFNREVGCRGWTYTRSVFLHELKNALSRAGIDYSCILNASGGFNLNNKVTLVAHRFVLDHHISEEI